MEFHCGDVLDISPFHCRYRTWCITCIKTDGAWMVAGCQHVEKNPCGMVDGKSTFETLVFAMFRGGPENAPINRSVILKMFP